MKTFYSFLLILPLFFPGSAFSQDWFSPDHVRTYLMTGGFAGVHDYFNLEVEKDTVVHGQACQKLIITGAMIQILQPRYVYSADDRVYAYQSAADSFAVLYDFNRVAGDTVTVPTEFGVFQYVIEVVDTVQAGPWTLRRQQAYALQYTGLPSGWKFDILDGIGIVGEPFVSTQPGCSYFFLDEAPYCYSAVDGFDLKFVCTRNAQGVFSPYGLNCALVDTDDPAATPPVLDLFPNPVLAVLNIELSPAHTGVRETTVRNACGQEIARFPGLPAQIATGSFPAGLYLLTISLEGGQRQTVRFVKK
ncbi:MAG: T9SS type A sorting domain-containing protein [Bacteroidetes bacterium]|nr:MAG: T9SS type A sorting domain-containing protein [Bacteroidota bacterium]